MKLLWLIPLLALAVMAFPMTAGAETYTNPMTIEGQYPPYADAAYDYGIGDPFVMRYNGMYYMYPSSCEDKVRVFTSRDLVNWQYEGTCTLAQDVVFAFAPEVVYWRGDFYMVTSPGGGGHYILKSDSPLGPFELITDNFGHAIDGSFYVDDDGRLLLLFPKDSWICAAYIDEKTMTPETISYNLGATLKHWTEGPGLFRRGEWRYLTFTGNHLISSGYRVAYASQSTDKATAKYVQDEDCAIIIHSVFGDDFRGLGHSSNVIGPDLDSIYTAYHSYVNIAGPARLYNLDRLLTNGGLLYSTGPTNFKMPVPSMPDVWGDLSADAGDFERGTDGWYAATQGGTFTQECNFILNGGTAMWQMGQTGGSRIIVNVDESSLTVMKDQETMASAGLPYLGLQDRLHTLRIEHTPQITYFYIDGMRVLTLEDFAAEAVRVGAQDSPGVAYSFAAHTSQALGSGDQTAVKAVPGVFHAVHCVNAGDFAAKTMQDKDSQALVIDGEAIYNIQVAQTADYAFTFTVSPSDAGKTIVVKGDGETLLSVVIPQNAYGGEELFTFTSGPVAIDQSIGQLSLCADQVTVMKAETYLYAPVQNDAYDFSSKENRSAYITLGAFKNDYDAGTLSISPNKTGFAMFGSEGNANYQITFSFAIPAEGSGTSGLIVNATNVSLYSAQVSESFFGYSVGLSSLGVTFQRQWYGTFGQTVFKAVPQWQLQSEATLIVQVRGNQISVYLLDQSCPILTFSEPNGFVRGLYGFYSTGKELTVYDMEVEALE